MALFLKDKLLHSTGVGQDPEAKQDIAGSLPFLKIQVIFIESENHRKFWVGRDP